MVELSVLIVEDEPLIQLDIEDALRSGGYTTSCAENGAQATKMLMEPDQSFRALVTDIRMPGEISGWDVARRARELNAEIAVVYVTGDSVSLWTSRGVPKSIILQKPFASAQLLTAVSQLLNAVPATDALIDTQK